MTTPEERHQGAVEAAREWCEDERRSYVDVDEETAERRTFVRQILEATPDLVQLGDGVWYAEKDPEHRIFWA
ncbi:hypothetical protein KOI35_04995 [Actinoplanes bogorensis]|uniref:Uncharacterized protein n=1 Tax=Paractinoplanes bogorensis TaxID=1610840 RepID=A0ABS5YHA4_9ACTN|nr:hypothetical protein [Actinoplanes bogorensis]MBU2662859.1 hypothetical protein [Actinoplanes bogorensis]